MSQARINPVTRWLPSLADLAFLMPIVWLFAKTGGAPGLLGDGDTGWHLRTGEWILTNGRVPDKDLFSFTKPGEAWYAWEWLWDLVFGWLNVHAGLAAVVLVNVALLGVTFALLYRLVNRVGGNPILAAVLTFLAAAASSIHWLARPHLFTLLFVVVFYAVLESGAEWRRLAVLPVLTVLWVNLHGGFFVGIALIVAYGVGEAVTALATAEAGARHAALVRARRYLAVAAAAAAVTLVNPYGYRLHVHIYHYLSDPFLFTHNDEFIPLNFRHPAGAFFEVALLLGLAAAFWCVGRRRFTHALLVAVWAHLALYSARNIPIYMIVAAPVIAQAAREWLERLQAVSAARWVSRAAAAFVCTAGEVGAVERIGRAHLVSLLGLGAVAAILFAPAPPEAFQAKFPPKVFPAGAVAALGTTAPALKILTHDQWGDYLIYRFYPAVKVFVDGRSDFYGTDFSKRWLALLNARHDWGENLRRYGIDTILLPPSTPLVGALKESSQWRVVYDDGTAIVFRPAGSARLDGEPFSAAGSGGPGRDRAITKPQPCDRTVTANNDANTT